MDFNSRSVIWMECYEYHQLKNKLPMALMAFRDGKGVHYPTMPFHPSVITV